jgi:hypothetical protein
MHIDLSVIFGYIPYASLHYPKVKQSEVPHNCHNDGPYAILVIAEAPDDDRYGYKVYYDRYNPSYNVEKRVSEDEEILVMHGHRFFHSLAQS